MKHPFTLEDLKELWKHCDSVELDHIYPIIEVILADQKQSLKDEAVKRIEEKVREYCDHDCNDCDVSRVAMEHAQDIIRSL